MPKTKRRENIARVYSLRRRLIIIACSIILFFYTPILLFVIYALPARFLTDLLCRPIVINTRHR